MEQKRDVLLVKKLYFKIRSKEHHFFYIFHEFFLGSILQIVTTLVSIVYPEELSVCARSPFNQFVTQNGINSIVLRI